MEKRPYGRVTISLFYLVSYQTISRYKALLLLFLLLLVSLLLLSTVVGVCVSLFQGGVTDCFFFSLLTILSHCKSNCCVFGGGGDGFKHYGRLIVNVELGLIVRLQKCFKAAGQRRLDFLCNDSNHAFTDNKTTDRITIRRVDNNVIASHIHDSEDEVIPLVRNCQNIQMKF